MAEEFSAGNLYLLFLLFKFVTRETKEFSAGNLYLLFLLFKFVTCETKELFFFFQIQCASGWHININR